VIVEATVESIQSLLRSPRDGMGTKIQRANWGISHIQPQRDRRAKTLLTKEISNREDMRDSDETIVNVDPTGQHNLTASQGSLGRIVHAVTDSAEMFALANYRNKAGEL
jgi:hypothetical protein